MDKEKKSLKEQYASEDRAKRIKQLKGDSEKGAFAKWMDEQVGRFKGDWGKEKLKASTK